MSDMIDRLDQVAKEAGELARERLASPAVRAQLVVDVRQGVRRRRLITAALTAAVMVVGVAAAVGIPHFVKAPPVQPAGEARAPIATSEGLITYSDGSMQVLNQRGEAIDVPAPVADAPAFGVQTVGEACAVNPQELRQGWTTQFVNAFELMTFGRPLLVNEAGYHALTQGQRVVLDPSWRYNSLAFSVDVDPYVAPHIVMTTATYVLGQDGRIAFVGARMEAQPAIEYSGDKKAGTYTATLTSRGLVAFDPCPGVDEEADPAMASGLVQYLVVNMFLNDGHGHVAPLGTHTSWITMVKENA